MKSENKPSKLSPSKGNNRYSQDLTADEVHFLKEEFYKDAKLLNVKIYSEKK
jgi:hypothetical protein